METKTLDLLQAVGTIDKIVDVALKWMNSSKTAIRAEFLKVFSGAEPELISHYLDKWDNDFARFYLNADERTRRMIFTYYSIPLEPDKYADDFDLNIALIDGIPKFDVFPFESYVVHLFYLVAYNNSLSLLKDIAPEAFQTIVEKMDLFGNGLNWSKAWLLLAPHEKENLVEYSINKEG
jgi:hypothetical protein